MARQTLPLTDSQIKNAKAKDKEYRLADGNGLMLRIRPTGSKVWIFRYKVPLTTKRNDISFGAYPIITLVEAREKRTEALRLLANDIDPQAQKASDVLAKRLEKANTFEAMMNDWLIVKRSKVSGDHAIDIERSLKSHVMVKLGDRPITELTNREVIDTLQPLAASGKLEMVKRVCQRINEIMVYCVNTGVLNHNSFAGINSAFTAPLEKHLPTIPPAELPTLMRNINLASINIITRVLLEWQLHTAVRPSEAAGAEWQEIDIDNKLWIIPAQRMKRKEGEHRVPLTDQTLDLLEFIRPISGDRKYLFPAARNPQKHTNPQTANMAIKRMGYHKKLVAHGLRSIFSTLLNAREFDHDVVETCLAHIDTNATRRSYNRGDYLERRRIAMQWWSNYIEEAASKSISISMGNKTLKLVNQT
jgi:integrase